MPASQRKRSVLGTVLTLTAFTALRSLTSEARTSPTTSTPFGNSQSTHEPLETQVARAAQPGRGRTALAPWQIPLRGWKDILLRTWEQIDEDRLLAIAAGVVFFALLALFPAVTVLVSAYGLFTGRETIGEHLTYIAAVLPTGTFSVVQDQIARVIAKGNDELGLAFLAGLAMALWSANTGMKAVMDALNVVYEEPERRGFFKLNLISLAFTVGAIVALLTAVGAVVVAPIFFARIGLGAMTEDFLRLARWPLLGIGMLAGLAVLYRYGPSRRKARWQWVSVGALLATLLWLGGSALLSWYMASFADYNATYGSLGGAIGIMMWMWMTTIVILLGAELNSEIEHQTAQDSTEGPPKPIGTRGAAMADTVGEAKAT